jgi:hypothetical protein
MTGMGNDRVRQTGSLGPREGLGVTLKESRSRKKLAPRSSGVSKRGPDLKSTVGGEERRKREREREREREGEEVSEKVTRQKKELSSCSVH